MKYLIVAILLFANMALKAQSASSRKSDSIQIRTTVMSFYNWYKKGWQKLSAFRLYSGKNGKTDQPPYRINWKGVESYLNYLKVNVPQLGSDFIKSERSFFRECDSAFKVDIESEIPYGFDYDRFTDSQEEPQWLIDELKKSHQWVMDIKGVNANVDVLGYFDDDGKKVETVVMCFKMKKEKGKWKIAEIGCRFVPPVITGEDQ